MGDGEMGGWGDGELPVLISWRQSGMLTRHAFGALIAVLILKLVVLLQLRDHPLLQPDAGLDTTAYAELAAKVVAGDLALGPGVYYVSPLYIYFLAAGLALFDSFTAVRVLQVLLGTASVACIFLSAREWFGERAAWIAAALAAATGLFTFYEVLILQASIDAFLTSAALLALTFALRRDNVKYFAIAGIVFGIAALNRPNMPLGAAGVAVALLIGRRFQPAALVVAGLLVGMAPAAIRNAVVAGQWTFVSSHGGLNFYIGNGEGATGFYRQIPGISPTIGGQEKDARRVAEQALGRSLDDAAVSEYFYERAWTRMREHPAAALTLFAKKLAFVFSAQHIALPHSYPFYAYDSGTLLLVLAVGSWLLMPLGLVGLAAAWWRAPAEFRVWIAFVPGYAAGVAAFFIAERYRLPLLVPLCVGAGAAVDMLLAARSVGMLATLLALLVLVNWPTKLHDGRWEEGLRLAQRLIILGRYDEANAWVERFEPRGRPGATHYGAGAQLLLQNQPERALEHLTKAHALNRDDVSVEYALGQALVEAGRGREALPHLRRGFDAGIDLHGDDPERWLRAGRLASRAGAPELAEPYFRRGAQLAPHLAAARQQLGLNLLVLGKTEEAADELGEAVRLDPRDADSLAHLAYCEVKLGRLDDARTHLQAALSVDPSHTVARQLAAALR